MLAHRRRRLKLTRTFRARVATTALFGALICAAAADDTGPLPTFLGQYCYSCHDADVQKAELNLEGLMRGGTPSIEDAAIWETVLHMITEREMPPKKKKKQPTQDERDEGANAVRSMLQRWTESLGENPGRVTARRLNRVEYNNTIRDLFGVDFEPARNFPPDEVGYGFDSIGDVLSLSPVLMERYLDAAEQVAEKAIVAEIPEWPPVERPDLNSLERLSWESKLLRLPMRGRWRATFAPKDASTPVEVTLEFAPEKNTSRVVVEGKRVRFNASIEYGGSNMDLSVQAEERATGHLLGHWSHGDTEGVFQAVALPGRAFTGGWDAVVTLPDGRDLKQKLTLDGSGEELAGNVESATDRKTRELDEVIVKDESLSFTYGIELEDNAMDVFVRSKLERDGTLRGRWLLKNGAGDDVANGPWWAVRPEPEDSQENIRVMGRSIGLFREGEARMVFDASEEGDYRLHIASYQQKAGPENAILGVYLNGREIERIDIDWQKPRPLSRTLSLAQGKHSIGLAYLNNYVNNRSRDRKLRGDRNLFLRSIEVAGPLGKPQPELPASHTRIIPQEPAPGTERSAARKLIGELASRAYRRPARPEEIDRVAGLVDGVLAEGGTFGEGMRLAVQAVLVSPHFLFRWEMDSARKPSATAGIRNLDAYEIASRLSYFLWSSMPDDELFSLAMDGSLREETVIRAQVKRMLADPKSEALVRNFAGQWLQIRNLDSVEPDDDTFPEFDPALRQAMAEETYLFFNAILREDRSVLELLDSDFSYLNAKLAKHYELEVEGIGEDFQRVSLPSDSRRGGVLTHASILTITSNPRRTSPVTRGKWVLEQILGTPPPPPPPNVPELEETRKVAAEASLRERMRIHRENPDCAGCHSKMDPIGFALENFDGIGRWRDFDGDAPIDAAVTLGNGANVSGPESLKDYLISDENYTNSLIENMLTYATGRGIEFYDRPAIESIQDEGAKSGFKLSSIVSEIAVSAPFLKRTVADSLNE